MKYQQYVKQNKILNNCLIGKENVYINIGIDKVLIIILEEIGFQGESGFIFIVVLVRLELFVKISILYENIRIYEMVIKELMYVVIENFKDNNRQFKE